MCTVLSNCPTERYHAKNTEIPAFCERKKGQRKGESSDLRGLQTK